MSKAAIERAIKHVGSQKALATGIGKFLNRPSFAQQTVSYWIKNGTKIEAEYWPAFEFLTANAVTRRDLRPDVFAEQQSI